MHKKLVVFLLSCFMVSRLQCYKYMNDQEVSFKEILAGLFVASIDYNIFNNGDGTIGGARRLYGIHNMSVTIDGYESIVLVKDDVCLYPHLFTILSKIIPENYPQLFKILGNVFPDTDALVQRWACVKWILPLSFSFKIENDRLIILSSISKYKFLTLFRAKETIALVKSSDSNVLEDENLFITVKINGRSATVSQKTVLQLYSLSSLQHQLQIL